MSEERSGCPLLFFRAFHAVVPHSVVSLRRMKKTTELGQPNEQDHREH